MKTYMKENKIIFTEPINDCINSLYAIVKKIEDKNNNVFPTEEISKFIKNCNLMVEECDRVSVPCEYLEFVKKNKKVFKYFKDKQTKYSENKKTIDARKSAIDKYRMTL